MTLSTEYRRIRNVSTNRKQDIFKKQISVMRRLYFIFFIGLIGCGGDDNEDMDGDGPNPGDLSEFLMDNILLPNGSERINVEDLVLGIANELVELDITTPIDTKVIGSGGNSSISLVLIESNEDITHVGLQIDGSTDIWIIPITENAGQVQNVVEYQIERPSFLCTEFNQSCLVTTASQYTARKNSSGKFELSQPIMINMAAFCGDCIDLSCAVVGNVCFANEEDPNLSVVNFQGLTYNGGVVQCTNTDEGMKDYGLGNGVYGVGITNGRKSGTSNVPFPGFLTDFSLEQSVWISINDGLGQNGQFGFLGVSGTISFSGNKATFNVVVEDSRTVFDPDADHASNRFSLSGSIDCGG